MKHIKLFESYSESDIDSICRKYGLWKWTVNSDGSVDVNRDVYLASRVLDRLPIKFGIIKGDFICRHNCLVDIKGAPSEVYGDFDCSFNQLITLEGSPRKVRGRFKCNNNPIYDIYKLFPDYKAYLESQDYSYLRGTDIVKVRFKEAPDELEINKQMPKSIPGYKYI